MYMYIYIYYSEKKLTHFRTLALQDRPLELQGRDRVHCLFSGAIRSSNKKLLETSATLVVTGALLVVTRSY